MDEIKRGVCAASLGDHIFINVILMFQELFKGSNMIDLQISNDIDIQGSASHTVNRTGNRPPDVVRNGQLFECLYDRLHS